MARTQEPAEPTEPNNFFYEILKAASIEDLPVDLEQELKQIMTENIEFEILKHRCQQIIHRLQDDSQRLMDSNTDTNNAITSKDKEAVGMKEDFKMSIERLKQRKVALKESCQVLENEIKQLEEDHEKDKKAIEEDYEPQLEAKQEEIEQITKKIEKIKRFLEKQVQLQEENNELEMKLSQEKALHKKILDEIEKEKVIQIDSLRRQMLLKIREVKVEMLNLNEDQLVGTTRLTVIQNAQLTGELEYQSKQTEHLMYRNNQMKNIITNLTKDLADHKEVENELAKRSHFCQKVIKKNKEQALKLRQEIQQAEIMVLDDKDKIIAEEQNELTKQLNKRIQAIEIKFKQTHNQLTLQQEEYADLIEKMKTIRTKYGKTALLLTIFIEHNITENPELLDKQNNIHLDIEQIKELESIKDMDSESAVALALVLLKQLQPYISELSQHTNEQVDNAQLQLVQNSNVQIKQSARQQRPLPDMRNFSAADSYQVDNSQSYLQRDYESKIMSASGSKSSRSQSYIKATESPAKHFKTNVSSLPKDHSYVSNSKYSRKNNKYTKSQVRVQPKLNAKGNSQYRSGSQLLPVGLRSTEKQYQDPTNLAYKNMNFQDQQEEGGYPSTQAVSMTKLNNTRQNQNYSSFTMQNQNSSFSVSNLNESHAQNQYSNRRYITQRTDNNLNMVIAQNLSNSKINTQAKLPRSNLQSNRDGAISQMVLPSVDKRFM